MFREDFPRIEQRISEANISIPDGYSDIGKWLESIEEECSRTAKDCFRLLLLADLSELQSNLQTEEPTETYFLTALAKAIKEQYDFEDGQPDIVLGSVQTIA